MKKTTICSICLDILSFVLLAVAMIFAIVNKERETQELVITITALVAVCSSILFKLIFAKKSPIAVIVPIIFVTAMLLIYNQFAGNFGQVVAININLLFGANVISIVLIAVFAIATVFSLIKNYKWASIATITYLTLLFIYTVTSFINISVSLNDKLSYILEYGAVMTLNIALIVYFVKDFISSAKKEDVKEETSLDTEEKEEK